MYANSFKRMYPDRIKCGLIQYKILRNRNKYISKISRNDREGLIDNVDLQIVDKVADSDIQNDFPYRDCYANHVY